MKILRIFCNFLLCLTLCIGISLVQIAVYDTTAAQSSKVEAIHLTSGDDEYVAYFDTYAFWATDITTNYKQDAKYRIRNVFNWKWWKKGMAWADYALDFSIATAKPIVVPIAQVNAVSIYYDITINDPMIEKDILQEYKTEELANNALYELYFILDKGYGDKEAIMTLGENPILLSEYVYTGDKIESDDIAVEYARWTSRNKTMYNHNWKLIKYNCGKYDRYFSKFITVDEYGQRDIKTAVVVLYYQQIVSTILAIAFTCKYPINFFQGRIEGKIRHDQRDRK